MATKKTATNGYSETWDMCFHIGTHGLNMPPDWGDEGFDTQTFATPQTNFKGDRGCHPTPKPRKLIELFIRHGSAPGDTILDPFAGGGTTGHAANEVGQRRCILIEQSDEYCDAIEGRLGIKRVTEVVSA
jgi:DNA modification methylase